MLARQPAQTLEAAKVWVGLEPDSGQARNTLAAVLISQGPLSESKQFLSKLDRRHCGAGPGRRRT